MGRDTSWYKQEDFLWITRKHSIQRPSDSIKRKKAEDKVIVYLVESATAEIEKDLAGGIRKWRISIGLLSYQG
ncbi:MAG: hypothetical protein Q8867_09885 [Bacteroidota bacterium]|nr:hypothetical protein [Bacteroidota bacterium]